ncbi:MAG: class I SAM-dependent methyltransferase [Gammaproteobacteria bacterium]
MRSLFSGLMLAYMLTFANAGECSPLSQALNGAHRSSENKARDRYRHPEQTLAFFDVKEDMTVVEIWPGAGWYTEILAPYLKDKGKLYAAHFSKDSEVPYFRNSLQQFVEKIGALPDVYGKLELTVLQPPEYVQIAPAASADRVLTFRNVHNWMGSGQAEAVFVAMYKALKPGGILGVVEHRSAPSATQDAQAKSGYVSERTVIGFAEQAGFKLMEKSEINANPLDTKDHPAGVWTLPPSLRLKDQDREKYLGIGESDRMTLKFVKPE